MCFTAESAKLSYQGDRDSQFVDLAPPDFGEHLYVRSHLRARSHLAPGRRTQVVIQRDVATLREEKLKFYGPDVVQAIKSEPEAWVHSGCISRQERAEAWNAIDAKQVIEWKHMQESQTAQQRITSGVMYKELVEAAGKPLREVNYSRPGYCVPILRELLCYEDFDPTEKSFHCRKPGTGCNDAPRWFFVNVGHVHT